MRNRWNVSAACQLPPPDLGVPAGPPSWEYPEDPSSNESKEKFALIRKWGFGLDAIREIVIPEQYRDWQYFGLLWSEFIAVCVLFDPPETELLTFANIGGPHAYHADPGEEDLGPPRVFFPAITDLSADI